MVVVPAFWILGQCFTRSRWHPLDIYGSGLKGNGDYH